MWRRGGWVVVVTGGGPGTGRFATEEAAVVRFVGCDVASFLTGQVVRPNAGLYR